MCAIVEKTKDDDLEKLFKEGNEHGVGELMKEIRFTDKERQVQQFANDQAAYGKFHCFLLNIFHCFLAAPGCRGNRWSLITVRMGKYSIFEALNYKIKVCYILYSLVHILEKSSCI